MRFYSQRDMKKISFLILVLLCLNCKSFLYNSAFKSIGAYDENVNIEKMILNDKNVVFIPMIHLCTELFYQDVVRKVDSLKKKGFIFYYEQTKADIKKDTVLRKIRKIRGIPVSKNGYKGSIDSIFGDIKLKKKLVNQPAYEDLGLSQEFSRNVDASVNEMIDFYEIKYGEIILNNCDFSTSIYEKTTCKDEKIDEEILDDVVVNFRNSIVVKEVINDKHNKIALVYGKAHFIGIKEELLKKGFFVSER